jgi:hypothetical protein
MKSYSRAGLLSAVAFVSLFIATAYSYAQSPMVLPGNISLRNTLLPLPEDNYSISNGATSFACQEDHNKGIWDVRCVRSGTSWASNPSQALINTIQAAMCYAFTQNGPNPVIQLPAGAYHIGGGIQIPPNVDVEGTGGTNYGFLTQLTTTDTTQPMFIQVPTKTFTCNGTPYTDSGAGGTLGNVSLFGGGTVANTDIGVLNTAGSDYIHNISFDNFGGACREVSGVGINSRGSYIFAQNCLEWFYFSGAYNTTGFTDTGTHAALNLSDVDSSWDHVEQVGFLQDGGYYNRYFLVGVNLGATWRLTDSFIQINPHNVWVGNTGGSIIISHNRFDDGWWDSIRLTSSNSNILFSDNIVNGYCTSRTLNPANFPTNPGGITTDPVCSGLESFNLGSQIHGNTFGQTPGQWASWAIGDVYLGGNVINGVPSVVDQPAGTFIGDIGGVSTNIGSDVTKSLYNITFDVTTGGPNLPLTNTGLGGRNYLHYYLNDSVASAYTGFTGGINDTYITINVANVNDSIANSATITTCSGATLTSGIHWFWVTSAHLYQVC